MEWWNNLWQKLVNFFNSNIWSIILFFVVLALGLIAIHLLLWGFKKIMRRKKVDPMAIRFIAAIIRLFLYVILVLLLLYIIGVPITGLTTAFSAAVLAVGMALKEFLGNIASGIILIGSQKYKAGDFVAVNGTEGRVVDINFLFTTLRTWDETQVTLPNSSMVNSAVTNYGAYRTRRVAIMWSVAYESDTELVRKTMVDVMLSCGLVYKDPAPLCRLKTLNESSLDYFLTCYCDNEDYWDVYYYIMDRGYDECKRHGITIPFKQIEITQKKPLPTIVEHPEGLPARNEKIRLEEEHKITVDEFEDMGIQAFAQYVKTQNKKAKRKSSKKKEKKSDKPEPKEE